MKYLIQFTVAILVITLVSCMKYIRIQDGNTIHLDDKIPLYRSLDLSTNQIEGIRELESTFLMESYDFGLSCIALGKQFVHHSTLLRGFRETILVIDNSPFPRTFIQGTEMEKLYSNGYFELPVILDDTIKKQLRNKFFVKESDSKLEGINIGKILQVETLSSDTLKVLCNFSKQNPYYRFNNTMLYNRIQMKVKYFWTKGGSNRLLVLPNFNLNIFTKKYHKYLYNVKNYIIYDCQITINVKTPKIEKLSYLLVRAEKKSNLILNSDNDSIYFYRNKKFYKEFESLEKIEEYIEIEKKIKPDIKHYIYRSDSEFMKIVI